MHTSTFAQAAAAHCTSRRAACPALLAQMCAGVCTERAQTMGDALRKGGGRCPLSLCSPRAACLANERASPVPGSKVADGIADQAMRLEGGVAAHLPHAVLLRNPTTPPSAVVCDGRCEQDPRGVARLGRRLTLHVRRQRSHQHPPALGRRRSRPALPNLLDQANMTIYQQQQLIDRLTHEVIQPPSRRRGRLERPAQPACGLPPRTDRTGSIIGPRLTDPPVQASADRCGR